MYFPFIWYIRLSGKNRHWRGLLKKAAHDFNIKGPIPSIPVALEVSSVERIVYISHSDIKILVNKSEVDEAILGVITGDDCGVKIE